MQATAQLIDVACDGMVEEHESDTWRSIEAETLQDVLVRLGRALCRRK